MTSGGGGGGGGGGGPLRLMVFNYDRSVAEANHCHMLVPAQIAPFDLKLQMFLVQSYFILSIFWNNDIKGLGIRVWFED